MSKISEKHQSEHATEDFYVASGVNGDERDVLLGWSHERGNLTIFLPQQDAIRLGELLIKHGRRFQEIPVTAEERA